MEASDAAAGQADAPQAAEGADGGEAQEASPQFSPELISRLEQATEALPQMQEQLGQLDERFNEFSQPGQEDQGQEDGGQDGFLYDEWGNPYDPQTGQQLDPAQVESQQIEQAIESQVEERLKPVLNQFQQFMQQQQEQRLIEETGALEQEFPDLADPKVAGEVVEHARELASRMGNPEQANDPTFIRMAYLAQQAERHLAAQGGSEGGPEEAVQVEGGGGMAPLSPEEDNPAMRIVQAGRGDGSVLGGLR